MIEVSLNFGLVISAGLFVLMLGMLSGFLLACVSSCPDDYDGGGPC